jgi:GNAT superfamily N-acetyltransferase
VLSRRDADVPAHGGLRWAQPSDGELLKQAGYSEVELAARFAAAGRAAIALEGGRLLAVSWYVPAAHAPRPYDWCRFALPDSAMWNIELRVSPDHAGRGLRAALLAFAHAALAREGYRYIHLLTDHGRAEDTGPCEAAGFIRVEELIFLRIARRAFLWAGRRYGRGRWYPGNELMLPTHRL